MWQVADAMAVGRGLCIVLHTNSLVYAWYRSDNTPNVLYFGSGFSLYFSLVGIIDAICFWKIQPLFLPFLYHKKDFKIFHNMYECSLYLSLVMFI